MSGLEWLQALSDLLPERAYVLLYEDDTSRQQARLGQCGWTT